MKVAPEGGMSVEGNEFKKEISKIIHKRRPVKLLETGTYLGTGTTLIIAKELEKLNQYYQFFTIESNPNFSKQAINNLRNFSKISVCNGYSVPKNLLPSINDLKQLLNELKDEDIYVDFKDHEREECYMREVNHNVPDDFLNICLRFMGYSCDMIILDSAGHMGFIEFEYVLSLLKSSCIFVLDDVYHIKHHKSLKLMKEDKRFNILSLSKEKFGFCIAEYIYK
jgi:hypothetical protein